MSDNGKVLIWRRANSTRSQIGEGLLRHLAGNVIDVFSAGAKRIHWSFPDPAAVSGDDAAILASFVEARDGLEVKLRDWLATIS